MTGKRKRAHRGAQHNDAEAQQPSEDMPVKYALLALYYPEVVTLREYLLSKLPATSKVRRRRIVSIGREHQNPSPQHRNDDLDLAVALDQTLIGVSELKKQEKVALERHQIWTSFSQRRSQEGSRVGDISVLGSSVSQSEVGWLFFVFEGNNLLECFHSNHSISIPQLDLF